MKRFILFFMILASVASAQKSLDLGTISRLGVARTVPVAWNIPSANIQAVTDRALSINGGFLKVSPENANLLIEIRELAPGRVELVIMGTKPSRVIYSETFEGSRSVQLALRACDRAVEKILGTPGFYTGKIAFISDRTGKSEVYISDLFFQSIRQVTGDRALAVNPTLSPSGRSILYTSYYRAGFPDVYRIDLATGRRTPIANFQGLNLGGGWSPQGDRIALILSSSGNPEVYLTDPEGLRYKRLTRTTGVEAGPVFSPDGSKILFTSDQAGRPQLYLMPTAGGPMTRVPTNISNYCAEPTWNPLDPNLIAFTVGVGKGFQIAVYDFAKRQSKIVTRESMDAIEPCWLSDGRHLIYTARTSATKQLMIVDTETGRTSPISSLKLGRASQASFSK